MSPLHNSLPTFPHPTARREFGCVHRAVWLACSSLVAIAMLAGTASAQSGSREDLQRRLQETQQSLQTKRAREGELTSVVNSLASEREQINADLMRTANAIQETETKMTAIEGRLGELEIRENILRGALELRSAKMSRLLAAMQRMGRNPPPVIVTQRKDALAMVRSAMLLARTFPELRNEARELRAQLTEMTRIKTEVATERDRLRGESIRLSAAQAKLEGLMVQKKTSLTAQRRELDTVRSAAARITKNVANLNQLIASLDLAVERSTGLGAYNRKIEAAPATREPAAKSTEPTRPLSAPTVPTAPTTSPKPTKVVAVPPKTIVQPKVSLTPGLRGSLERADRLAPAIPFHRAKGRLPLPAAGRLVLNYGDRTRYGRRSKGVVIETRDRAQITSPADGWVVYAGPFRSYGQLLIINTGGGYHIIMAGLSRIDVQLGQFVLASEPIGAMGSGSGKGSARTKPVLYVEFRRKGQPIDPKPWWVRGRVVAQR